MSLTFCKECGNQISQQAKSCPKCGAPQKKPNSTFLLLILILLAAGGGFYYWKFHDDKTERIAAATEILNNNRADIIGLATTHVENRIAKATINLGANLVTDCIIDSLAVRLADKYTLSELNDLKTKPASNIIEVTKLVTENTDVCLKCLPFQN